MAIKYLIDTNVFLEILLDQKKKEICKIYLKNKFGNMAISDFSLHSIGVILFRINRYELYNSFVNDVIPQIEVLSLEKNNYSQIPNISKQFNLDFDDAYQVAVAGTHNLKIATMDKDFEKVKEVYKIDFVN